MQGSFCQQHVRSLQVVLADISGFTPLTEGLSKKGSRGLEELNNTLNSYFGDMIGASFLPSLLPRVRCCGDVFIFFVF